PMIPLGGNTAGPSPRSRTGNDRCPTPLPPARFPPGGDGSPPCGRCSTTTSATMATSTAATASRRRVPPGGRPSPWLMMSSTASADDEAGRILGRLDVCHRDAAPCDWIPGSHLHRAVEAELGDQVVPASRPAERGERVAAHEDAGHDLGAPSSR